MSNQTRLIVKSISRLQKKQKQISGFVYSQKKTKIEDIINEIANKNKIANRGGGGLPKIKDIINEMEDKWSCNRYRIQITKLCL